MGTDKAMISHMLQAMQGDIGRINQAHRTDALGDTVSMAVGVDQICCDFTPSLALTLTSRVATAAIGFSEDPFEVSASWYEVAVAAICVDASDFANALEADLISATAACVVVLLMVQPKQAGAEDMAAENIVDQVVDRLAEVVKTATRAAVAEIKSSA